MANADSSEAKSHFMAGAAVGVALGVAVTLGGMLLARHTQRGVVTIDVNELGRIVETQVDHVHVDELASWIVEGRKDYVLIDIRTPQEYARDRIPGAINVPLAQLGRADITANRKIVLYGQGGIHAAQAWMFLRALGHKGAYALLGGLEEWQDAYVNPELPDHPTADDKALYAKRVKLAEALAKLGK